MANSPYSGAETSVTPQIQAPDDLQKIDARPEMFGGAIAQGMKEAGQGAVKAGQFYGQVAADDGTNQLSDRWNKRLYGDPSKMVTGPDGKPTPDTGYFGLKGADMLRARPQLAIDMDNDLKEIRAGLSSPESQLQFDQYSRRIRQNHDQMVGHAGEVAMTQYGQETNKSSADIAKNNISVNAADDNAFNHNAADLQTAYLKTNDLTGGGATGAADARMRATQDAWHTRIEAIRAKDPAAAATMAEAHQKELGALYPALAEQLKHQRDLNTGTGAADHNYDNVPRPSAGASPSSGPAAGANGIGLTNTAYTQPLDHKGAGGFSAADHYSYLKSIGASNNEALMLTGGAASESSFDPNAQHDPKNGVYQGHGLYGHNDARMDMRWQSWQNQAKMALTELRSRPEGAAVNAAQSVDDLAVAQMRYEQPMAYTSSNPKGGLNYTGRLNTLRYFSQMANGTLTGSNGAPIKGGPSQIAGAPAFGAGKSMQMPQAAGGQALSPVDAAAPALPSTPGPGTLPPLPPPPPSIEDRIADVQEHQANAMRAMPQGMSYEAQEAYRRQIETRAQADMLGLKAEETRETAIHNHVSDEYSQRMDKHDYGSRSGGRSIFDDINNDPRLTGIRGESVKDTLRALVTKRTGNVDESDMGPEHLRAIKAISAPFGAEEKISDPLQIMQMEADGRLTKRGASDALETLKMTMKDETAGVAQAKTYALVRAKQALSFDQELSAAGIHRTDPDGEKRFSAFAMALPFSYDKWVKDNKDPKDFYTPENIDKMIGTFKRTRTEEMYARMSSDSRTLGEFGQQKNANDIVPAPSGADPKAWQTIAQKPPADETGTPFVKAGWQAVLQKLIENPTPEAAKAFNDSQFGKTGLDGAELIKMLTGKPPFETGRPLDVTKPVAEPKSAVPQEEPAKVEKREERDMRAVENLVAFPKLYGKVYGAAGGAIHKLHEWLQGEPEDVIAKAKTLPDNNPLKQIILDAQKERISERDKAKQ
jgi:hypothetical protein